MTTEPKCLPECWKDHKPGPFQGFVYHAPGCPRAPGEVCWHCKDVSPRRCCGTVCCNCKRAVFHKPEPKQGSEEPIQPVTELEAEKSTSKILRTQLALAVAERDEARATKDMHKERQEEAWAEVTALRAENERLKALEAGDVLDCEVCRHFVIRGRGCEVCRLRAELAAARKMAPLRSMSVERLVSELAAAKEEIGKLERDVEFLSSSLAAQRSKATLVESALAEANSHIAFVYRERDAERAAREKAEAEVKRLEEWLADRILMTPEEIAALEANPLKPPDSRPNRNLRQYNISKPEPGR